MTQVQKREYMQVAIPNRTATRIIKIMETLGYRTVSEFVNEAVRDYLRSKESEYDRIKLEKLEAL